MMENAEKFYGYGKFGVVVDTIPNLCDHFAGDASVLW